jgi:multidrug resistance efflux pump
MKNRSRITKLALLALPILACAVLVPQLTARDADKGNTLAPTRTPDYANPASQPAPGSINANGILLPAHRVALSLRVGGHIKSLPVEVGVDVQAGDLLAELDSTALEFELQRAQESLAIRQAALDGLLNGPATALVERASVEHARQVAQAEIALQVAQWQLEAARLQDQTLTVALARSELDQLDLQLAQARAQPPVAEVVAARVSLARAQDTLDTAQVEYDKALERPWEPQEVRDAYAKAVWLAQQEVELAQAQFDSALDAQRVHALGLEALDALRDTAAIQLTQTLGSQAAYTFTLALLEAEVELARLQLDGLEAWQNPYLDPPPPAEVAQAKAELRQADLAVQELEWQLQGAQLHAPFDGVVAATSLHSGEWAAAGASLVELLDTTRWHVETRNVGELNIGRVRVGQKAVVWVNAFSGETLNGRVITISPSAVVQQGDTTYTLIIELEPTQLNLRTGMTAQIEILIE